MVEIHCEKSKIDKHENLNAKFNQYSNENSDTDTGKPSIVDAKSLKSSNLNNSIISNNSMLKPACTKLNSSEENESYSIVKSFKEEC